jgi:hypothetical protein
MRCGYWPCGWCSHQRSCVRKRSACRGECRAKAAVGVMWIAAVVLLGLLALRAWRVVSWG